MKDLIALITEAVKDIPDKKVSEAKLPDGFGEIIASYDASDIQAKRENDLLTFNGVPSEIISAVITDQSDPSSEGPDALEASFEEADGDDNFDIEKFKGLLKSKDLEGHWKEAVEHWVSYNIADDLDVELANAKSDLTYYIKNVNPEGYFRVEGSNIGWRNLSGDKNAMIYSAEDFIEVLMPANTDYTWYAYKLGYDGIGAVISHHDAPTGEVYRLTKITEEQYDSELGESCMNGKSSYSGLVSATSDVNIFEETVTFSNGISDDAQKIADLARSYNNCGSFIKAYTEMFKNVKPNSESDRAILSDIYWKVHKKAGK